MILSFNSIFNISFKIKPIPTLSTFFNYSSISSYPIFTLFKPFIKYSFKFKTNLKKVIPSEKISATPVKKYPLTQD